MHRFKAEDSEGQLHNLLSRDWKGGIVRSGFHLQEQALFWNWCIVFLARKCFPLYAGMIGREKGRGKGM